jgi:nickel-dependent lactate racemase
VHGEITNIKLPYGNTNLNVDVNKENLVQVVYPDEIKPSKSPGEYITRAMECPMGTRRLPTLAKGRKTVAIAVDDNTRPCPTHLMMPHVLKELYSVGVKKENITIIFATGTHREVKEDEAERILGADAARSIKHISNGCKGDDFTYVGTTSRGTDVEVKNVFMEADLKILLGDVEIHYFAGYGGTRKSILPGICNYSTIQQNYKKNFFHPNSKPGLLDGNPMHENMTEAARLARPDFCLNVVQNSAHKIVGGFAGDIDIVLRKGAELIDRMYKVKVKEKADIVVTAADGSPHDVDMYQAYKAFHLGLNVVKDKGVIVLVAQCPDGHGSRPYYEWMTKYKTAEEMANELKKEFIPGGHKAYYHLMALKKVYCTLVSDMDRNEVEKIFRLRHAENPQEALSEAYKRMGKNARVLVIPKGTTTLIECKEQMSGETVP